MMTIPLAPQAVADLGAMAKIVDALKDNGVTAALAQIKSAQDEMRAMAADLATREADLAAKSAGLASMAVEQEGRETAISNERARLGKISEGLATRETELARREAAAQMSLDTINADLIRRQELLDSREAQAASAKAAADALMEKANAALADVAAREDAMRSALKVSA